MPRTSLLFYRSENGNVPVLQWLDELRQSDRKGWAKCVARLERLGEAGHELRRPEADFLRDGIYELRIRHGRVQHRILYFFHGRNVAVLVHGMTKEGSAVPPADIERALRRMAEFASDPDRHPYTE